MAPYLVQNEKHTQKLLKYKKTQILKKTKILGGKCLKYKEEKMKEDEILDLVPYLSHDIMSQIFNRVPATSLFDNCTFVSKQCFNSITDSNFLTTHFLRSKPGILLIERLQEKDKKLVEVLKFVEFNESKTEFGKVHHLHSLENERFISPICAGLCIIRDMNSIRYRVMNPVTKETFQLPPREETDLWHEIVFDRANMNYMVAVFSRKLTETTGEQSWTCMITLYALDGSRRQIQAPNNSRLKTPVLINGVLYCDGREEGLWCCDLSVGAFYLVEWPINRHKRNHLKISGEGGFLCCVQPYDWEVNIWILRQQKWVHRCFIEGQPGFHPNFMGCLGSEDLFLFSKDWRTLAAYNVKFKQWMVINLADNHRCGGVHVNSILPLTRIMRS